MELSSWRKLGSAIIAVAVLGFAQTARAQSAAPKASAANENEIRTATVLFYDAYNSALHGDLDPLTAVWSHRADVSNLSAAGGRATGWNEVHDDFQNMVRIYPSGEIAPEDILIVADGDIGYSVCTETGQLRSADGPMVKFNQRATNIFRHEDGKWKLIHHHADITPAGSQAVTR